LSWTTGTVQFCWNKFCTEYIILQNRFGAFPTSNSKNFCYKLIEFCRNKFCSETFILQNWCMTSLTSDMKNYHYIHNFRWKFLFRKIHSVELMWDFHHFWFEELPLKFNFVGTSLVQKRSFCRIDVGYSPYWTALTHTAKCIGLIRCLIQKGTLVRFWIQCKLVMHSGAPLWDIARF